MKNVKIVKIVLCVITLVLLLNIAIDVRAEDAPLILTTNNATNNTTNNATNNTANNAANTNIPVNTTNKTNTSSYVNNSNNLPKTGVEDYTTVFIILGVCIVSAIYAYKKANDYNGIR